MDKFLRDLGGAYSALDPKAISRRVHDSLNTDPTERKLYMKQKVRLAALLTAAVVALCGTALAFSSQWDVLRAWFDGDSTLAGDMVDRTARSVSDQDYTFTVESSVSDGASAFLLVRIDALSEEAKAFMASDDFIGIDTFGISPMALDPSTGEPAFTSGGGTGYSEVSELRTDTSSSWRVTCELPEDGNATTIHARMGYMEKGLSLEVPLSPVETVTLDIDTAGQGVPSFDNPYPGPITLERVILSPFTIQIYTAWEGNRWESPGLPILFRMADGALRGYAQMTQTGGQRFGSEKDANALWHGDLYRRFREVQDLSQISGIVVWGVEYPLDGSAPRTVAADPHLVPFSLPLMEGLNDNNPHSIPLRALCEGLGATCDWDNDAKTATMTYRGSTVVLTWKSTTALVDGQPVEIPNAPDLRDGKLCLDSILPCQVWDIDVMSPYDSERGEYLFWLITP